tara:strand:- start:11849 stop:12469 length:621 start_codon:yes stop_codon:yes gene_type:complete
MGFWSNLFRKKELPKPKSKKVGDKGYVRKPVTKPVVKKEPPKEESPKQSFDNWEIDMMEKYIEFDSDGVSTKWGDTWKRIAANELDGATLVNGRNPVDLLDANPKVKDDLDIMLDCCRAELQRADIGEGMPAPFYFKRAAILFAKQKLIVKEIQICKLWLDAFKHYMDKKGKSYKDWTLPNDFTSRIDKAQIKLDKLKTKSIKKSK